MAGTPTGTTILISSMMINAPSTLPKSRMHRDSGRITSSRILIGVTIATGCEKLFSQPFAPFARIPATSISTILMSERPTVTFRSLVGGFSPNRPITLDTPI